MKRVSATKLKTVGVGDSSSMKFSLSAKDCIDRGWVMRMDHRCSEETVEARLYKAIQQAMTQCQRIFKEHEQDRTKEASLKQYAVWRFGDSGKIMALRYTKPKLLHKEKPELLIDDGRLPKQETLDKVSGTTGEQNATELLPGASASLEGLLPWNRNAVSGSLSNHSKLNVQPTIQPTPVKRAFSIYAFKTDRAKMLKGSWFTLERALRVTTGETSGCIYYPSGRPAILSTGVSKRTDIIYHYVFDDTPAMSLLAMFCPPGSATCYKPTGDIWFNVNPSHGLFIDYITNCVTTWEKESPWIKRNDLTLMLNSVISFRYRGGLDMSLKYETRLDQFFIDVGCVRKPQLDEPLESPHLKISDAVPIKKTKSGSRGDRIPTVHSLDPGDFPIHPKSIRKMMNDSKLNLDNLVQPKAENEIKVKEKSIPIDQSLPQPLTLADAWTALKALRLRTRHTLRQLELKSGVLGGPPRIKKKKDEIEYLSIPAIQEVGSAATELYSFPEHSEGVHEDAPVGITAEIDDEESFYSRGEVTPEFSVEIPTEDENKDSEIKPPKIEKKPVTRQTLVCPLVLRQQILYQKRVAKLKATVKHSGHSDYSQPNRTWNPCNCNNSEQPMLSDVELDEFIAKSHEKQVIVICISSSRNPPHEVEETLDRIYRLLHSRRRKPCLQFPPDTFRLCKYDIEVAQLNTGSKVALLVQRNAVIPGMVLMYLAGKLIFGDVRFNGYGVDKYNFVKQVNQSIQEAATGFSLPMDFKFGPSYCKNISLNCDE